VSRIILPQCGGRAPPGARAVGARLLPRAGLRPRGQPFTTGQEEEWQRHVAWCARQNRDAIEADAARHRESRAIFDPESWDPEWTAHQRKVGERMKREGRLVPKPHER
jgi:hypothetical protein